ncbi:MAG: hypothetical protein AB9834_13765 [Lentimicrobium sp.]
MPKADEVKKIPDSIRRCWRGNTIYLSGFRLRKKLAKQGKVEVEVEAKVKVKVERSLDSY